MAIPVDRHGNSIFSPIFIALLLDSAGLLTQPAHDAWLSDTRSNGWWAASIATLQAGPADVSLGALYAQALESDYCAQHFQNLRLSPEAAALSEMWGAHAQLVVAGSAGTVADPDLISVRDAFSILLSHPEIFNGYLPGELQEVFLTILSRDSAQQFAVHLPRKRSSKSGKASVENCSFTIQFYISCRITGVPPLQSDFYGLSSALKDDANEPKKRKETRTKPTKMARKKSTLRMTRTTTDTLHAYVLRSR